MGRRRTIGQSRSAGAGRPCKHPQRMLVYQIGESHGAHRIRCKRCGQMLLAADLISPRPRDKPYRPPES